MPVDPYYYSYFAKVYGISTEILLAGRRVNNSMFKFIFKKIKNDLYKKNYDEIFRKDKAKEKDKEANKQR